MRTFIKILLMVSLCVFSISSFAQTPGLWGMTYSGGTDNDGVLFEFNPASGTLTKILDFGPSTDKGRNPSGALMQASNGKLYGMTHSGGTNMFGVLFEFDPSGGTLTKKLDFDMDNNGAFPDGALIQASNGKLYGMTSGGGANKYGVLFEYDLSSNTFTKILDFNWDNGAWPDGSLLQASNGKLYGVAQYGGISDSGILFEYEPTSGTFTKKIDFGNTDKGDSPKGSLIEATNGKLYGMTYAGGTNNDGVLYEYDPTSGTFTKKFDFDGANNGANPAGSLMQASNGKLYGMTYHGGTYDDGVLFEFDLASDTYTKMLDFDGADNGANPEGSLMQTANGNLYGVTQKGGTNNDGIIFEYNPASKKFIKKLDFDGTNGANPYSPTLIETNGTLGVKNIDDKPNVSVYPNPSSGMVNIEGQNIQSVSVINLSGRTVLTKTINSNNAHLDLKDLPKSAYFIRIHTKKGVRVDKLILK